MGDLVSNSQQQQATTSQQVGVQGGSANSTTIGVGANAKLTQGAPNSIADSTISNSKINITTADPAIVASALDTVNNAVSAGANVSLDSVNLAHLDTVEALQALQTQATVSGQTTAQAIETTAAVASNAQNLAYGQPTQTIGSQLGSFTTSTWIAIVGALIGLMFLLRRK